MRGFGVFLWQEFRQTAGGLLLAAATLALWGVLVWAFKDLVLYAFSKNLTLVVGTTFVPVFGAAVLLFLQENRGKVGFSYPCRLLVLPVHTWVLVSVPLLYRVSVAALYALAAGWFCNFVLKDVFYVWPQALMIAVALAAAQALVFLACGYGSATGLVILIAALVLSMPGTRIVYQAVLTNLYIPGRLRPEAIVPTIGQAPLWAAAACILYWTALAYWGARRARREVPNDPVGRVFRVVQRVTYFERDRATFPSAAAAQSWLEWRRGAYLFPWFSLALGLILTLAFRVPIERTEMRFVAALNIFAVAPALAACFVGYTITRGSSDYLWFAGARPLTTGLIARARLRAGLKAVLWAYVLLVLAFVVTFRLRFPNEPILGSLIQDLRVITSTYGSYTEGLLLLAFMATAVVLMVWTLFWLARSAGVMVWGAGAIVSLWFSYKGRIYVPYGDGLFITPATVFLWGMGGLLGLAAVVTMLVALRRGYLTAAVLLVALACWGAMSFLVFKLETDLRTGSPFVIAACFLLPFVPLASIPLTLEWQRHR